MKAIDIKNIIKAVILRNNIVLSNCNQKIGEGQVILHWWKLSGEKQNVGDYISTVVYDYVKELYGIRSDCIGKTKHIYAIGSIIDGGYQNAIIWGSGLLRGKEKYWWRKYRKLDIRCVRGPETRELLIRNGYLCPDVYGDPAVLLPLIYQPNDRTCKKEYVIIPHMKYDMKYPNILNPMTNDWKSFIDQLIEAKLVISSSLHGIILAEAYGIPAILLAHDMNMLKYRDYYYSTGRTKFPIAGSIEEALTLEPAKLPDFSEMQQNLIKCFPKDVWE